MYNHGVMFPILFPGFCIFTDSRWFGHEAVLRPIEDKDRNVVVIPDPQQTALADGVIVAWRIYAKVISVEHNVSLEVWRPSNAARNQYTLVGKTFVIPRLRFQLEPIQPAHYIHIRQGDVLAIYYPEKNPIPWSPVPCAYPAQRHLFLERPPEMSIGKTLHFTRSAHSRTACRHYSVTAVLANKTNSKVIQDWICPNARPPQDEHHGAERKTEPVLNNRNHKKSNNRKTLRSRPSSVDDAVLPVHLILIIIGSLLLLFCVIGFISYYHAMKS
ncbi:hypothetical protein CAPTEDRAFT_222159 [Capitella teleta]|uniref:Uncharacterized protein n=1 Tax=Capitella teleta TaxID=283909 RepID=X2ASX2_CAPTE|nr:hypothetical protein CAPTEDRAFT_222159 [Capitella teleta]|eukprot:ELT88399.1 hypothetical protein CAPTEDRAFT_222159 [Capitella teleta]